MAAVGGGVVGGVDVAPVGVVVKPALPWRSRPVRVFDLETTGVDPEEARVVTACVATVHPDGSVTDVKEWLADPGVPIPDGAADIHGVTTEHARAFGRPAVEVVREVVHAVVDAWSAGLPVVAFNAAYDLTVLDLEVRRHGLGDGLPTPGPVLDPYVLDRMLDQWRKGKRTLTAMCDFYGVDLGQAHTAQADAVAAGRLLFAVALAHDLPDDSRALWVAQVASHRARQESFAAFLRGKGEDASGVDGSWPWRPWVS